MKAEQRAAQQQQRSPGGHRARHPHSLSNATSSILFPPATVTSMIFLFISPDLFMSDSHKARNKSHTFIGPTDPAYPSLFSVTSARFENKKERIDD